MHICIWLYKEDHEIKVLVQITTETQLSVDDDSQKDYSLSASQQTVSWQMESYFITTTYSCFNCYIVQRLLQMRLHPPWALQTRTFRHCWCKVFTGRMPTLSSNEECQSTQGDKWNQSKQNESAPQCREGSAAVCRVLPSGRVRNIQTTTQHTYTDTTHNTDNSSTLQLHHHSLNK